MAQFSRHQDNGYYEQGNKQNLFLWIFILVDIAVVMAVIYSYFIV